MYEASAWDEETLISVVKSLTRADLKLLVSVARGEQQMNEEKAVLVASFLKKISAMSPGIAFIVGETLTGANARMHVEVYERFWRNVKRTEAWLIRGFEDSNDFWWKNEAARERSVLQSWIEFDALPPVRLQRTPRAPHVPIYARPLKKFCARVLPRILSFDAPLLQRRRDGKGSIYHLSVQLYTTPIVATLRREEKLVTSMIGDFINILIFIFSLKRDFDDRSCLAFTRYRQIFVDMRLFCEPIPASTMCGTKSSSPSQNPSTISTASTGTAASLDPTPSEMTKRGSSLSHSLDLTTLLRTHSPLALAKKSSHC